MLCPDLMNNPVQRSAKKLMGGCEKFLPALSTYHTLQRLLIYGTGQGRADLEGGPVAGAPKVALDVGFGGGPPQVPDGHGGPGEGVHDTGVRLSHVAHGRGLPSLPESHAHAVVPANVA